MNIPVKAIFLSVLLSLTMAAGAIAQDKPAAVNSAQISTQPDIPRIVYDMSVADTAMYTGLMRQLNNVTRGWPGVQIEVVVHGKALNLLLKDKSGKSTDIKALQEKGVVFAACENTMRMQKVSAEQLLPGVITVPMGIGEIVTKQQEGWSYIKF